MTSGTREQPRAPLGSLGEVVSKYVWNLQRAVLADHRESAVVVQMARLRHAASSEPGSVPAVWPETIDLVPTRLQGGDEPSTSERAAHVAVTLFALHQQGRATPMHRAGGSLGSAARALSVATDREVAIRRRFQAIALSDTDAGIVHHLRSLVTLLRGSNIPLDYGRLADDLHTLFERRHPERVRLRWGRDFRPRSQRPDSDEESTDDTNDTER
ncbi:type I-E CRISPR-associated protein Cse2/CasB [Gordonia sp. DT101]|uniref:type I-E CRISPR-associated protein Cse2/CasB n=1 Tax=Gordonia sp. DT101 TaxID=3416545 RepID=UPI003CEF19EC